MQSRETSIGSITSTMVELSVCKNRHVELCHGAGGVFIKLAYSTEMACPSKALLSKIPFNTLEGSLLEEKAELGGIQRKIISLRKSDCTIAK